MAFSDNPKSDKFAKNSEKSLIALKNILLQENGFLSRSVSPDFGVDENVELLYFDGKEYTGASNKHFAIQLKSVSKKNPYITIGGRKHIKLQFETSRLGYLLRNPPAFGLIVVFDLNSEKLYFEFAEKIYYNLKDKNNGDGWQSQKLITIHIDLNNILDAKSAKVIYSQMISRHNNATLCFNAFGEHYGIKVYEKQIIENKIDFNNPNILVKELNTKGWGLIQKNEFSIIIFMLNNILQREILSSSNLLAIAATTYCESGNFIDSQYYLKKYNQKFDSKDSHYNSLEFIKYKTDFALGELNHEAYLKALEKIKEQAEGKYNQIIIQINLLHIKLLTETKNRNYNKNTLEDIISIIKNLESSGLNDFMVYTLSSHNIFNIIMYYITYITSTVGDFKLRGSVNLPIYVEEIFEFRKKETLFDQLIKSTLAKIWEYAEENNESYLKASCLQNTVNYFFIKNLNSLMMDVPNLLPLEKSKDDFETKINQAFSAANLYEELGRYKDAYTSLGLAYELTALFYYTEGKIINNELSVIRDLIKEFSYRHSFNLFESQVEDYFNIKRNSPDLKSELIDEYVDIILKTLKLPEDRRVNITSNIKDTKRFEKLIKSKNFNLLEDLRHTKSPSTHFKYPITYILECKKCKQTSAPQNDIDIIISFMDSHDCEIKKS